MGPRTAVTLVGGLLLLAAPPSPLCSRAAAQAMSFNRLMKPPAARNAPPAKDGIHDPDNDAVSLLQAPMEAFEKLPRSTGGNQVDWVKALADKQIRPRSDKLSDSSEPAVMDLDIVREVKGSMPNVVYPHKAHTEWLDCSNCHPAIFVPLKGANSISMAEIMLGGKCGVCHGKVAFPVSDCRRCHSENKREPIKQGASGDPKQRRQIAGNQP